MTIANYARGLSQWGQLSSMTIEDRMSTICSQLVRTNASLVFHLSHATVGRHLKVIDVFPDGYVSELATRRAGSRGSSGASIRSSTSCPTIDDARKLIQRRSVSWTAAAEKVRSPESNRAISEAVRPLLCPDGWITTARAEAGGRLQGR